ncbi:MAG TPA: biopolymer transporter ExbD [Bdellovibrionales bacterium]|nr:MAG: hypothetical protein A2Z97_14380 [Bdellovibrionales bacterium GWB1_52_6]OFZ06199.1 MAG: hypothetical protein A2X97_09100 [Bdellovibrionales bacterium GWA1_52_35]OFZ37997.1 MAG: hypothetical protein A2070_00375 [Bdellovibrionales bacterium GWC1_52_8]HAR43776.1 biopolymer transporter ExbD [Bdellovibrionales bacterium]HCM41158.1 biopolymer transporter ExbD [Bdellovibrionales bacterium]
MAGGASSYDDDEPISSINVTPLVDVVLVLLIMFLITAPVIYQSAIKVQLPQATTGEQAEKTAFQFTITRAGEILWDKEKLEWPELTKKIAELRNLPPDQTAIINADEATTHGNVIRLMDTLRQAGITRFAMNVESGSKPKP